MPVRSSPRWPEPDQAKMSIRFCKYEALGNDYLVLADSRFSEQIDGPYVQRLCDRHCGIGADGVLTSPGGTSPVTVTIWNADGSQAEKSGNGLRIFARFLWDEGWVADQPIRIAAAGGEVCAQVLEDDIHVWLTMGRLKVLGAEDLDHPPQPEILCVEGRTFEIFPADLGNPHCVIFVPEPTEELAREWGKKIETHARFPQRTNVQFVRVVDRNQMRLEIWERGSGYTKSSGSSASAAVGVAHRRGLVDERVDVRMQGGPLEVMVGPGLAITICGPVHKIADVTIDGSSNLHLGLDP